MMALTKNEAVRKDISRFYTEFRHVTPKIRGKDLIRIGVTPGPAFTKILNEVRNAKLDGYLDTREKEMDFTIKYARENNMI
jgi:tRNA nucleotidyltransferase (CCA-adding enzyme)